MVDNSLCFGLYCCQPSATPNEADFNTREPGQNNLIGFARCITDYVTFLYLTDVYVLPAYQGKALGAWLIACVQEVVEDMPHLRRSMLMTNEKSANRGTYQKRMGMEELTRPVVVMARKGKGAMF